MCSLFIQAVRELRFFTEPFARFSYVYNLRLRLRTAFQQHGGQNFNSRRIHRTISKVWPVFEGCERRSWSKACVSRPLRSFSRAPQKQQRTAVDYSPRTAPNKTFQESHCLSFRRLSVERWGTRPITTWSAPHLVRVADAQLADDVACATLSSDLRCGAGIRPGTVLGSEAQAESRAARFLHRWSVWILMTIVGAGTIIRSTAEGDSGAFRRRIHL